MSIPLTWEYESRFVVSLVLWYIFIMNKEKHLLDPLVLAKISSLILRARFVVEGVLTGLHRSPHHGQSIEFAEHKEYSPGDDLRHIDWKVYGKSDKYYVKQFEEETNLKGYILLDASGSMGYRSNKISKLDYGITLAASLAYLMLKQLDAVGLLTFNEREGSYIPPRARSSHLQAILQVLEGLEPGSRTDLAKVLNNLAEKVRRRALVILISDLFDEADRVLDALKQFRHRKNEIIIFHILDPDEIEFPFKDLTVFLGMEGEGQILADPRGMKVTYQREIRSFIEKYRQVCLGNGIDYCLIKTSTPLDQALTEYLAKRERFFH